VQRGLSAPPVNGALETSRRTIRDACRAFEVIKRLRALLNRKETSIESVKLNDTVEEVIALSLGGLQRTRGGVRSDLARGLPLVIGDCIQLHRVVVVLNLLRNSSDAMNSVDNHPRQLLIRTERDGEQQMRLSVRDVGAGFDPQAA
jgi:C4-dicarboxylate-specific signal transduction histidine kinase